jgi:hypothetical protein
MVYKDRKAPSNFYSTAVATIAKSASWTTASDIVEVFRAKTAYLQVSFYGTNASHTSGTVTFNFVARGDHENSWPTTASFVVEATPNGTAQVIQDEIVDCEPYYDLKVLSITNGSASYAVNTLQANISYKF